MAAPRDFQGSAAGADTRARQERAPLYGVLGVPVGASAPALKRAFHAMARVCHPDRAGGDGARFARVRAAYETLAGVQLPTLREAVAATHTDMTRFLRPDPDPASLQPAPAASSPPPSIVDSTVLVLDSTNGSREGRARALRLSGAARSLLVEMRPRLQPPPPGPGPPGAGAEAAAQEGLLPAAGGSTEAAAAAAAWSTGEMEWLCRRVAGRHAHPAFPPDTQPQRQRQKVADVLGAMEWVDAAEADHAGTVVLRVDVAGRGACQRLPYRVWAHVFIGDGLRNTLQLS